MCNRFRAQLKSAYQIETRHHVCCGGDCARDGTQRAMEGSACYIAVQNSFLCSVEKEGSPCENGWYLLGDCLMVRLESLREALNQK